MKLAWLYILIGGVFETCWATTMSLSEVFTDPFWTIITLIIMPISIVFLHFAFKQGIPTGPGYAVWVGIGAIGAVIVSILMGEGPNALGFVFLGILLIGVIGMNLVSEE